MAIVILGGGPSALGVAWGLVELGHKDIILVEKEARLGGLSGSIRTEYSTIDFGPHRFSPEYPELISLLKNILGEDLLEVPNEHAVVFRDHVYRYPPRVLDFLNFGTIILSIRAVSSFTLGRTSTLLKRIFKVKQEEETFRSIVKARFGNMLCNEVVEPICNKVWGSVDKLDPEFANLRFSVPTIVQWGKKILGYSGNFNDKVFYYPRLGFQQAWDEMGESLSKKGVKILLQSQAEEISLDGSAAKHITIKTNGTLITEPVSWVVSTIPTHQFIRLLKPNPFFKSEIVNSKFSTRGMMLAYFLVNRPQVLPARVIIAPERRYLFNRLSEQSQFSRDTVKKNHTAVLADVLTEVNSDTWSMNDDTFLKRVIKDIEHCRFFSVTDIVESKVIRVPLAYPLPTKEREKEQEEFNMAMEQFDNMLCTGRFSSSDYNNAHTALKKGLLAADSIDKNHSLSQWYEVADSIRKTAIRD